MHVDFASVRVLLPLIIFSLQYILFLICSRDKEKDMETNGVPEYREEAHL